jgi:hypothetical protein
MALVLHRDKSASARLILTRIEFSANVTRGRL